MWLGHRGQISTCKFLTTVIVNKPLCTVCSLISENRSLLQNSWNQRFIIAISERKGQIIMYISNYQCCSTVNIHVWTPKCKQTTECKQLSSVNNGIKQETQDNQQQFQSMREILPIKLLLKHSQTSFFFFTREK
jgi:hypothetical protein